MLVCQGIYRDTRKLQFKWDSFTYSISDKLQDEIVFKVLTKQKHIAKFRSIIEIELKSMRTRLEINSLKKRWNKEKRGQEGFKEKLQMLSIPIVLIISKV